MNRKEFLSELALHDSMNTEAYWPISFTENITSLKKADLLNGFLFARLASDFKYSKSENPEEWFKMYKTILIKMGFIIHNFNFERSDGNDTVPQTVAVSATGNELLAINTSLETMSKLQDGNFHTTNVGNSVFCIVAVLSSDIYSEVRDIITAKLGSSAEERIKNIPID